MANISCMRLVVVAALVALLTLSLLSTVECGRRKRGHSGRTSRSRRKRNDVRCSEDSIAGYKFTFFAAWSREKFHRMYPRYRPTAQWSKIIGRTHDPSYQMWAEGKMAGPALKRFAEEGDSLLYDTEPQGYNGVFDTFSAEAIRGGEGKTSAFLLADGVHSRVSFVTKMVPSPDWFVGLDGLELCRYGKWRARAHVNMRPMDAGTDRGYTFTSPKWPSYPPEAIYQITSSHPNHPASAFLYPEYKRLPRIAYVKVERVVLYARKGPISNLKTDVGTNLVVFTEKPTTTTSTTTTTMTVATAISFSATDVANMADEDVKFTMDMESVDPAKTGDEDEENLDKDDRDDEVPASRGDRDAAGRKPSSTQPTTAVPETAHATPPRGASPVRVSFTQTAVRPATAAPPAQNEDAETFALETPDDDLMSLQRDVAQMQELADESQHILERLEENVDLLNESSRKPAGNVRVDVSATTARRGENPAAVLETDRMTNSLTASSQRHGPEQEQSTMDRTSSSSMMTSQKSDPLLTTSIRISPQPQSRSEQQAVSTAKALTTTSRESSSNQVFQASTSSQTTRTGSPESHTPARERPATMTGSRSSASLLTKSASTSITSSATTKSDLEHTTLRVFPAEVVRTSTSQVSVPERSSAALSTTAEQEASSSTENEQTSSESSWTSSTPVKTSVTFTRTSARESPKASTKAFTLEQETFLHALPGSHPENDPEKPQVRSGDMYTRGRWRTKAPPSTAEPMKAQSRQTFDEPQFAEIAKNSPVPTDDEPVDCHVTEWREWGPCTKTCGFGVRLRTRDVISHSRNGGYSCPLLEQETLCGSMRTCNWNHFSFLSDSKGPRRTRRRRHHHGQDGNYRSRDD